MQFMVDPLPLDAGGIGWAWLWILPISAQVFSLVGAVLATQFVWSRAERGLVPKPSHLLVFPAASVLFGMSATLLVTWPNPPHVDSRIVQYHLQVAVPIGTSVVVGSGIYWRKWPSVLAALGIGLAAFALPDWPQTVPSSGMAVVILLCPVVGLGVGYLASGPNRAAPRSPPSAGRFDWPE